jgi:uncharacterized protein (DUF58 family)
MIYPTRAAIGAAAVGAPIALAVALVVPGAWYAGLALPLAVVALAIADALIGGGPGRATARIVPPRSAAVGETVDVAVDLAFAGVAPGRAEIAIATDALVENDAPAGLWADIADGKIRAIIPLRAVRRGTTRIDRLWVRWRGPLGLVWKQRLVAADATMAILPDIRPVRERGAKLFERYALGGLVAQMDRGDGTDFDALVEYRSGMDRRAIDWKQSARHFKLHAKEFRAERNNQIVFAIDAGRQMSEPVAGLSRLDRMVSAALLTAWIALKTGDRVALHAFDLRPRIAGGFVSGTAAFPELQKLAARIDYSGDESNYTFALTTLASRLTRRSMVVLFTEFTDTVAADFMVRAAGRLAEKHLLLVVVLRDEELEAIVDRPPVTADDVTRAVTAAALLKERLTVLTRLRHLGAHVIESEYDRVGERLVAGYVDLKRRNLL